jgi:drug/metabolite transporter (DMT)-like permease
MTLLSSLAGYVLWFYALGRGGIGRIGSLQLIQPVITLGAVTIILDENLSPLILTSCVVILLGTFLAQRRGAHG